MKPYAVAQQRRWPPGKERWFYKIVEDGLACGMFERTITANGKLSDWNAQAVLVDKTDDAGLDDEPRITFNYRNVIEDIPSCHLTLASKVHDYFSHPGHGCFMQLDLKHGYWAVALHPDDRHLFAFAMPGIGQLQPTRMPQGTMTAGFSVIELMHIVLGYLPPVLLELRSHSALGSRPLENCDLHIGIDVSRLYSHLTVLMVLSPHYSMLQVLARCLLCSYTWMISFLPIVHEALNRGKRNGDNAKDDDGNLLKVEDKLLEVLEVAHVLPHSMLYNAGGRQTELVCYYKYS
jgi:hypothetical protein